MDGGNMVKLFCAVVGVQGSAFPVDIAASESVGDLKDAIAEKQKYDFAASKLELFLAKKGDAWLPDDDDAALQLEDGDIHEDIQAMIYNEKNKPKKTKVKPSWTIQEWLDKNKMIGEHAPKKSRQIHVLVVVKGGAGGSPTKIIEWSANDVSEAHPDAKYAITIEEVCFKERERQELMYYQERGRLIREKCPHFCAQILDKIDEVFSEDDDPLPFICVEGSSGMGKSQLAFALEGRRPYFYWLATPLGSDSQSLYQNFSSISGAFREMVEEDNPTTRSETEILNSRSRVYRNGLLWTYGFISALLEYCSSGEQQNTLRMIRFDDQTVLQVERRDLKAVRAVVDKMKAEKKILPFFVLDEMTPNSNINAGGKNMAAFQRNVFRACGLVVVIMGTDSKITNLVEHSGGSYKQSHKWMSLVPRFPPYQLMLHNDREQRGWSKAVKQYPVLQDIATHSRGRFARHFVDRVVKCVIGDSSINLCDLMDEACAAVSLRTHEGKKFLQSHDGKKAQLMAISYTNGAGNYEDEPPRKKRRHEVGAFGMHLHFANLVDEQLTDMTVSHKKLITSSGTWKPKCCFPAIDEDMLLYLAILGGRDFSSYHDYFCEEGTNSVKYIFAETTVFPVDENTNAVSHNYKTFENMVAHAIFCSSRRNGVRGIPFNEFFSCLLGEFQDEWWEQMCMHDQVDGKTIVASDLLDDYSAGVQRLKNRIIPFLAPPNAKWPMWILDQRSYGCKFGHLVRACNEERCDVYVQDEHDEVIFIYKCKYWEKNVDMSTMDNIIDGLDQEWNWEVAFVFCLKLADFRKPWGHLSVGCVKINCRDGGVKWIFQPETSDRKQLLIVFEVGSLVKKEVVA